MPSNKTTHPTRRTMRTRETITSDDFATKNPRKPTLNETCLSSKRASRLGPSLPATGDERTACMRTVNLSLQNLSAVTQLHWKRNPKETKTGHDDNSCASKVDDATKTAKRALERLRKFTPDDLDVERAACSIAGKLITLELYEEAIHFLDSMYPRLLHVTSHGHPSGDIPSPLHLLSLPYPTSNDPTVFTLLIAFSSHALNAILSLLSQPSPPFSILALVSALQHSHSVLAWAPNMKRDNIPDKTKDSLLTKAYTFISQTCTALSSSISSTPDALSIFQLRMYALSCLLYTFPGTIKSATFWDQVHKACLACARALSSVLMNEERESFLAESISTSVSKVVKLAQDIHECGFLKGRSFVQMCETWMTFALKGDVSILDHISELMGVPCPSSSSRPNLGVGISTLNQVPVSSSCSIDSLVARVGELKLSESPRKEAEPISRRGTKDSVLVECAQCCAIFVKVTTSLDSEGPELVRHVKEAVDVVRRYCTLMSNLDSYAPLDLPQPSTVCPVTDQLSNPSTVDAEVLRARGKLERALERMRRAGLRVLDAPQVRNKESKHVTESLLEVTASALEDSLTQGILAKRRSETKSTLTSLVDVLFALARSRLHTAEVDSYALSLSYLQRAVTATNAASPGMITTGEAATFFRCISGTMHNLGGTLYTADRFGGGIQFLKEGCMLASQVLSIYSAMCDTERDDENDREKGGRRQLEEQLFRRYELLGVCHSKIGDRKLAYGYFIESIRTFPYTHHLGYFSSAEPFASDAPPPLKQLSSILDRLTYAATCDLFLPPAEISLRHVFHVPTTQTDTNADRSPESEPISTFPLDNRSRLEIVGAILTRQLVTLENIGHKIGAHEAIGRILEDLLCIYDANWAPISRAHVLVAALSTSWRDGYTDRSNASMQFDVDNMGLEALGLLTRETQDSDSFVSLVPQLKFAVYMWLALHAYRRSPAGVEMMNAVVTHVEAACNILSSLLPGKTTPEVSPKEKLGPGKKANSGVARKGRLGIGTAARGSKKVAVGAAKSQPRQALRAVSLNGGEPTPCDPVTRKAVASFDLQPIQGLIQMNVHLLGLLGLVILKVKLLEVLKRVCEHQVPVPAEAYSVICVDLAQEYIKLGKSKRASALFNKCANVLKIGEVSDEVRLQYLLGHAEVLALGDNVAVSASAYREAQSLEVLVAVEEKTMPTAKRIRMRVERLERAALACRVCAAVQYSKDDVMGALSTMLQSLRLWNRAIDALSRLCPSTSKPTEDDSNPFEVTGNTDQDQPSSTVPSRAKLTPLDALSWRLLSHLVSTLFGLAHAYHVRGSPREALYFVQQVIDLAESTRAPAVVARACLLRGEVLLGQSTLGEGREALEKAASLLGGMLGIDSADAQRLKGDYEVVNEERASTVEGGEGAQREGDPREHYEQAWKMLDELERSIGSLDGGRRRSSLEPLPMGGGVVVNGGQGMVVPRLLSTILRRHIWLLRNDGDDVFKDLVDRLMTLPQSAETKGEEHAIMAKLTLHSVYEQFRADMFLSSLTESTIALPVGISGDKDLSLAPSMQGILASLNDAERLFWADLALMSRRGAVSHVREAYVSLAMIRALQSSLGKVSTDTPLLAARLLDASSAITLHREMLEAIPYKFADDIDDLEWPMMMEDGSLVAAGKRQQTSNGSLSSLDGNDNDSQRLYWSALEKKYVSSTLSPSGLSETPPKLPRNWTVVHITLTPDRSSMFVSRLHTPSSQPLLFCIPLRGRRDTQDDDESRLTLEGALHELREIVRLSDEGTRRAAHVRSDDLQARADWWTERAALDKRLQALLENIEFCWLGAFKTILSPPVTLPHELIGDLRARLEKLLKRSLRAQDKKKRKLHLDDSLLACFSSLSPNCRDEELEDLVYFILDLYQLHGVPVAISEVDMDQVTLDLRGALEEHAATRKRAKVTPVEDSHTFLVLDRCLQSIPWESLPVLRGQSVSRIPSLEFLLDRVHLAKMQRQDRGRDGEALVDRIRVDARKTYYVLNPSGDLKGTEGRFSSWLKEMHSLGWDGIVGRAPSEQEVLNALSRKDLVIYFGHGGGEQYTRSHKIRHLTRCAATMLWGCSSGALRGMGEYDRVGTPYNYMVAGCPTLVANLWDVTDRDIDKFTQAVFDELHLRPEAIRERQRRSGDDVGMSVVAAVARSREVCKLKYLTGAAPVVYGIPFYL